MSKFLSTIDYRKKLWNMEKPSEHLIKGKPWAVRLLNNALEITENAVLNWSNCIIQTGEYELDVDGYVTVFLDEISKLYEDLVTDVKALQEKAFDKIEKLQQKMQNLCHELYLEVPVFDYQEMSLSEIKQSLMQNVKQYEVLVETRRSELKKLHQKLAVLCGRLGREPNFLRETSLPMPCQTDEMYEKIEKLEDETIEREEKFFQLKEQIIKIMNELQITTDLKYEKELIDLPDTEVRITNYDMEQIQLFSSRLVKQLEDVRVASSKLRVRIEELWDILETDVAERDTFRRQNTGNSLETWKNLETEVRNLEDKKKANIQALITNQRQELAVLWDKCHCTQRDKDSFAFFYSESFTEDLIKLQHTEIEKWKKYYQDNEDIFVLLHEHTKIWNELKNLDFKSREADGYKNRGGGLLQEEKHRNKLKKRIPIIEKKLARLAHTRTHLLIFGLTIHQYIAKIHEAGNKEIKLKLCTQKQQKQEKFMGRSRMNKIPPCGTSAFYPSTSHNTKKGLM